MQENIKKPISYECINCCFVSNHKNDYNKHLMTAKHKQMQENAKENPKNPIGYECILCCFITKNKNNYNKHLLTSKHKRMQENVKKMQKKTQKVMSV